MAEETIEDAAKEYCKTWINYEKTEIASRYGFLAGAKWQAKRVYSDEEIGELVYNIIGEYGKHYGIMIDGSKLNELFEQFKKK